MEQYARFYKSKVWQGCRAAYMKKVGGLCERCLKKGLIVPAVVVHHRIRLTQDTVNDPKISTNFENLEALCWSCHEKEHKGKQRRYQTDAQGHVVGIDMEI